LKVHEKLTHSRKLVEGMKAGLKPDISDEENGDDDVRHFILILVIYTLKHKQLFYLGY
jgi:hypothetical protein